MTSKTRGGRRYPPYAFTEQGVAMLSSVLRSERAVQVNIEIMRTFVKLRRLLTAHEELARKLDALERSYDRQFKVVFVWTQADHQLANGVPTTSANGDSSWAARRGGCAVRRSSCGPASTLQTSRGLGEDFHYLRKAQ